MASVIVTLKIMPESPETDLDTIEKTAFEKIKAFAGEGDTKKEVIPIAFGIKSLNLTFVMNEDLGSPEELEKDIAAMDGVNSVETTDVRRTIG